MCDQESAFSDLWGIMEGGKCDGMEMDKYCIYSARRRQWIWKLKIVKINVDSWQNSRNEYFIGVWQCLARRMCLPLMEASMSSLRTHTKRENIMFLLLIRIGKCWRHCFLLSIGIKQFLIFLDTMWAA